MAFPTHTSMSILDGIEKQTLENFRKLLDPAQSALMI